MSAALIEKPVQEVFMLGHVLSVFHDSLPGDLAFTIIASAMLLLGGALAVAALVSRGD